MAAKKAPAKKMAAPKAAAKKTGSAAQFRKKEEADKEKAKPKVVSGNNNMKGQIPNSNFLKAGKDARGRASKYGTPVGPTKVSDQAVKGQRGDSEVTSKTPVKSSRGNYYIVREDKRQNMLRRDGKPRTSFSPGTRDGYYNVNDLLKANGKRDPKFGPAPKKKK